MVQQTDLRLNSGNLIPQLGLGVWQVENERTLEVVRIAIEAGYRSIDTAAIYGNEEGVGEGIRRAGTARDQLFVTTKLWNDRHGTDSALRGFDESLNRLRLDYVDLYLIHWPAPRQDAYVETWRALGRLKQYGRAKSIGVSNFKIPHLQRLLDETGIVPSVNQVELHPRFQQNALRDFHARHGIATESWSPLGQGTVLRDATIASLAKKHGRTPAQIVLRWHLESSLIAIPKSVTPSRITENIDIFGFELTADDMAKIAALDSVKGRIGPDPDAFS
ncbi:MAG: aldo/keto reductase [Dongiaceae bacterium]